MQVHFAVFLNIKTFIYKRNKLSNYSENFWKFLRPLKRSFSASREFSIFFFYSSSESLRQIRAKTCKFGWFPASKIWTERNVQGQSIGFGSGPFSHLIVTDLCQNNLSNYWRILFAIAHVLPRGSDFLRGISEKARWGLLLVGNTSVVYLKITVGWMMNRCS